MEIVAPPTPPAPIVPSEPLSDPRREAYCRARALHHESQRKAYILAGFAPLTANNNAWTLECEPEILHRIQALESEAARGIIADKQVFIAELLAMLRIDTEEMQRIERRPCTLCWDNAAVAAAMGSNLLAAPGVTVLPPDFMQPQSDCRACGGAGITRTVIAPTEQWAPIARKMLSKASTDKDGVTKVEFISRTWILEYLAKVLGWNIDKHVNLNANVDVPALKDASDADKAAFTDALFNPKPRAPTWIAQPVGGSGGVVLNTPSVDNVIDGD